MNEVGLHGDRDASVPVCSITAYVDADADWLPVPGYPRLLRPHGWVYLRERGRLGARVRAEGVEHLAVRPCRTPRDARAAALGPGTAICVDPTTWERVDIDLGPDAIRMRSGIRYLRVTRAGELTHLLATEPVPTGDWDR